MQNSSNGMVPVSSKRSQQFEALTFPLTKASILTKYTFNHQVLESVLPVLVLFCASWSGSSDIMTPIIEELALEFSGKITPLGSIWFDPINPWQSSTLRYFSRDPRWIMKRSGGLRNAVPLELVGAAIFCT